MLPRHVYVHVPFCARRCSYCDFSIAVRSAVPADDYLRGLGAELDRRFAGGEPWVLDTLYFGGGTPSRLGAALGDAVALVRRRAALAPGAEVTIEANPEDVTRDAVDAWRDAGVNRVSLGSQSFDDAVLRWMHRTHDASAIARAVDTLRAAGIENVSLDLIFALPPELERDWPRDVAAALALQPAHLSLYGLTIEPATPLGRWSARGAVHEAPEERYESEFLSAHRAAHEAGLEHYEVSNFALPGLRSRHNSAYWTDAPYIGLGPSAHGFDGAERRWNVAAYTAWLAAVDAGNDPVAGSERLTEENRIAESVYLGLRSLGGLRLRGPEIAHVAPWIDAGWGAVDAAGRLTLTPTGWLRLDALAADLTAFRSRS